MTPSPHHHSLQQIASKRSGFWYDFPHSIWLASSLSLCRNIDKFLFPGKLQQEQKAHILQLVVSALRRTATFVDGEVLESNTMAPRDREWIQEHYFIFDALPPPHLGEGFIVDATGQHLVLINQKEHIQLVSIAPPQELFAEWELLGALERELEKHLHFAFSDLFGFLAANLSIVGTGLLGACYLHLPALLYFQQLQQLLGHERGEGLLVTSLIGSESEFLGDIVVLKNCYTLGVTEELTVASLQGSAHRLARLEKAAREQLNLAKPDQAQDLISRALGVLQHSYEIGTSEALKALSCVKLGLELGWVKNSAVTEEVGVELELSKLNRLFFDCRRAHLSYALGTALMPDTTAHYRAQFLRAETKHLKYII